MSDDLTTKTVPVSALETQPISAIIASASPSDAIDLYANLVVAVNTGMFIADGLNGSNVPSVKTVLAAAKTALQNRVT